MRIAIYFLILLFIWSCNETRFTERDNLIFYFGDNLESYEKSQLPTIILNNIKLLDFKELNNIQIIRIDSIPFAYTLMIPYSDSLTENGIERMEGLAALISRDLSDIPVHVILTDKDYQIKKLIQFNKAAAKTVSVLEKSKSISIEVYEDVPKFQIGGFDLVLRNKFPELFATSDTINVVVRTKNNKIEIDVNVNFERLNKDKLYKEFEEVDPLYIFAIFDNRTIYFNIFEKETNELKTVVPFKKL